MSRRSRAAHPWSKVLLRVLLLFCVCVSTPTDAMCPNSCSGHGICDNNLVCRCYKGFFGFDCAQMRCPHGISWGVIRGVNNAHRLEECSGRGICLTDTGTCNCQSGFTGAACELTECPDSCSSHGKCISIREKSHSDVLARELYDAPGFSYETPWDAEKIRGCLCDKGYRGNNCALKSCPVGDDPLTTNQVNEVQLVQCLTTYQQQSITLYADAPLTQGSFVLFFGKKYTRPISFQADATLNSFGTSVANSLLALPGVTAVTVTKTQPSTKQTEWQISFPITNAAHNALIAGWKIIEVQQFICAADAGIFSVTFAGQTVTGIPFNADINTFRSMLMASIPAIEQLDISFATATGSTIAICSTTGTYVTIVFTKLWHRNLVGDLPSMTFSKANDKGFSTLFLNGVDGFIDTESKEIIKGIDSCRVIEQQQLLCAATGGRFALTFEDGSKVVNIPYNIGAQNLATLLIQNVPYIVDLDIIFDNNNVEACTSTGTLITIKFVIVKAGGARGDGDLAEILADMTNVGAGDGLSHISNRLKFAAAFTETVKGVSCVAMDQPFTADPTRQMVAHMQQGSGSFTLSFRGETSPTIPARASASRVQKLLLTMSTINGVNVSFTGTQACETPANIISLTFTQNFGNLPTVTVDGSLLTAGSTLVVYSSGAGANGLVAIDGTKENAVCSGRGYCEDQILGKCICFNGYTNSNGDGKPGDALINRGDCGALGKIPLACPGDLACSGHGTCAGSPTYKCSCARGWQGGDCSERTCPQGRSWFDLPSATNIAHTTRAECSGVGSCDRSNGVCKCPHPYAGTACEFMACGGSSLECSGHGQCLALNDLAPLITINGERAGFTYGSDPNDASTWDANKIRMCLCDFPYFGYDCSQRECPRGDDFNTQNQPIERQLVRCIATGGSFTLTFRDQTTAPIAFNANAATVKSALEAIGTIQEAKVTIAGGGTTVCSTTANSQVVMLIDFLWELGNLPSLKGSAALLRDSANGNGLDGSGTLDIASRGATLAGQVSVKGTRENALCSNHGECDFSTGVCACFANYGGSDGRGGPGAIGNCGFHQLKYAAQEG